MKLNNKLLIISHSDVDRYNQSVQIYALNGTFLSDIQLPFNELENIERASNNSTYIVYINYINNTNFVTTHFAELGGNLTSVSDFMVIPNMFESDIQFNQNTNYAYLTGSLSNNSFNNYVQHNEGLYKGGLDILVLKYDLVSRSIVWAEYVGGKSFDYTFGIIEIPDLLIIYVLVIIIVELVVFNRKKTIERNGSF